MPQISALDHLVLLVPSLASTSFLAGFDLWPGGTHADGLTENSLILFSDGVYIEVIAFTPSTTPSARAAHWWERVDSTNAASKAQVYEEPVKGGRETTAGKKLEWKVAFPVLQKGELRGVIPFWCEDVTPRGWRVESFTSSIIPSALTYNFIKVEPRDKPHPNGGVGIASFTLLSKSPTYIQRLSAILVAAPSSSSHQFELGTPAPLSATRVKVFVREPDTEAEKQWVEERGEGLWEVDVLSEKGNADELGDGNGARIRFRAA